MMSFRQYQYKGNLQEPKTPKSRRCDEVFETKKPVLTQSGLSLSEFKDFDNRIGLLGHGGFGDVYEIRQKSTGHVYALKEIDVGHVTSKLLMESPMKAKTPIRNKAGQKRDQNKILQRLLNEVVMMKEMNHPNIVSLKNYYCSMDQVTTISLILEYAEHGSLLRYIKEQSTKKLTELITSGIVSQILDGLDYLGDHRIVHGDIKAANVLIFGDGVIKLCDFGLSFQFDLEDFDIENINQTVDMLSTIGSAYWMAPEVILKRICTQKSDIWSLGATIIEMLTGKPPFADYGPLVACHSVGKGEKIDYPEKISDLCVSFLNGCFQFNPVLRSSIKELKKHPWVKACNNIMSYVELGDDMKELDLDLNLECDGVLYPKSTAKQDLLEKFKERENEDALLLEMCEIVGEEKGKAHWEPLLKETSVDSFTNKSSYLGESSPTSKELSHQRESNPTLEAGSSTGTGLSSKRKNSTDKDIWRLRNQGESKSHSRLRPDTRSNHLTAYTQRLIDTIRQSNTPLVLQLLNESHQYFERHPHELKRLCLSGALPQLFSLPIPLATAESLYSLVIKHYKIRGQEWFQAAGYKLSTVKTNCSSPKVT